MLAFEPNVVVIDDKPDEVQGIINYYKDLGIGCKYFHVGVHGNATFPVNTYSDVSLVYLDLYFTEGLNNFDAELCVNWIESIIPKKSFYVLIIWTREIEHQEEIKQLLLDKHLLPFKFIIHNKTDYISQNQEIERYDFTTLLSEINTSLDNTPALSEIGIWKKNIKCSANKVIGCLCKELNPEIFRKKLQKIIMSHGGNSVTYLNEDRKRSILFEALDQVLISNTGNNVLNEEIDEINRTELYTIPANIIAPIDKELNSWFHFKLDNGDFGEFIIPGLLSIMNSNLIRKLYSISNDPKIAPKLINQINNNVEIEDIVLVLSRPCDISQDKYGNNIKLLSGLILKAPFRQASGRRIGEIDFNGNLLPDSAKLLDHLEINANYRDVALLFDFRYIFSVPTRIFHTKFTKIKIFNKELLSELQVEYSSYSSRLGITQIF